MKDNIIEQITKIRQQEINDGLNASTVPPLYVVYDTINSYAEHNTAWSASTSLFQYEEKYIRVEEYGEGNFIEAEKSQWGNWDEPLTVKDTDDDLLIYEPVIKESTHDRFVTVCFTRKGAEDFITRERHNLKQPRIYVHGVERRNVELIEVVKLFGDTQL